ncbi:unnamed protein product [Brassica oleracea]
MAIVAAVDDSFKRPGSVPFSWEVRLGVPKTRVSQPGTGNGNTPLLQPPKKLSPLRLKPLSHSQPLLPPALSPPSSSFISSRSKSRSLSPLAPSFRTPSKLKPPPPSQSGLYSPAPSFRSTPRAFSERWQLNRSDRVRPGSESEPRPDFGFAGLGCFPTPMSPWTASSRRSVSPRWDSPKSSFSSLRFSPRLASEAEWVGFGLF